MLITNCYTVWLIAGLNTTAISDQLDKEVNYYLSQTYASSTQRTYRTHRETYLSFCTALGVSPVPAATETLCQYAAMLARTLKYTSVNQYMNIIRLLHLEWDLPNPLSNNFKVKSVLRGIRRDRGDAIRRKLPITPVLLKQFLGKMDLTQPADCVVWAAALLMFFGLLRRANVLTSIRDFSRAKSLCRSDISVLPWGLLVEVRHTKTIQHQERSLLIPLPRIHNHPLCPVQAVVLAFEKTKGAPLDGPAFALPRGSGFVPLTPTAFVARVRSLLSGSGVDVSQYAGHSFRRGGATWAYQAGLSTETIRILGDWRSQAYMAYLQPDLDNLRKSIESMVKSVNFSES